MVQHKAYKILQSQQFIWPVAILTLVIICIVFYFGSIKDKTIFPEIDSYNLIGYTDRVDGGNSKIIQEIVNDSILTLQFQLKEGFVSPYAGISVEPVFNEFINADKNNEIQLCLSGTNIDRIGIGVYTTFNYSKETSDEESLYHSYLDISEEKTTYNIPIRQLKHPEWWEDLHQLSELEKKKPDLCKIKHINIGTAYSPKLDDTKALVIYSIAFSRNNSNLFLSLAITYLSIVILMFLFLYLKNYRKRRSKEIVVAYKPVEFSDHTLNNDERCFEYINQNFHNNELSLELVSKATGISQRKITSLINDQFNCNFKTYINKIRINEAHRLLSDTNLNMGEIAYKIGFNNQSHFNRVFKAETQMSPSEYRDNQG